jgi:hypothetical protein
VHELTLSERISIAKKEYQAAKDKLVALKRSFVDAESDVIGCKIHYENLLEEDRMVRYHINTNVDDMREQEIALFRINHPELCDKE